MKKKRTCTTLSILLLTLALLLSSCQGAAEPMETGETNHQTTNAPVVTSSNRLEKRLKDWRIEDLYNDCVLQITLQPDYSHLEYTTKDFQEIGCTTLIKAGIMLIEGKQCKMYELGFDNPTKSKEFTIQVIKILEQREDIVEVASIPTWTLFAIPNDEQYNAEDQWAINHISLPSTWDFNTGSSTVYVGIIDSGIDATHPDLQGRVDTQLSYSFVGDDPSAWGDTYGHGTEVAGIIGAVQVNKQRTEKRQGFSVLFWARFVENKTKKNKGFRSCTPCTSRRLFSTRKEGAILLNITKLFAFVQNAHKSH